jgi:hypothetical protein
MASRSRPAPMTPGDTGSANVSGFEPAESLSGCKCTAGKTNEPPTEENHVNTVQKAILRACWQEECDTHAPRPWLRWLLIRVVGMTTIPSRKSEKSQLAKEQWLALRKDAALRIDPETAEVYWTYGQTLDPYGVENLPEEYQQIQRNYFARSPGSNVWVLFDDLPDATRDRLWARIRAGDFADDDMGWFFGDLDAGATDLAEAASKE